MHKITLCRIANTKVRWQIMSAFNKAIRISRDKFHCNRLKLYKIFTITSFIVWGTQCRKALLQAQVSPKSIPYGDTR